MTCVAAIEEDGKVWICGDSAGVAGWSIQTRADKKVFKVKEYVFGFTSSFRMGQILNHVFEPPKYEGGNKERFLVRDFMPELQKVFSEQGYQRVSNEEKSAGTFLVGFDGELFKVEDDYQISKSMHPYQAVGCGQDIALGSLHTTRNWDLSPKERLNAALSAAEKFSAGVCSPFNIVSI